MTLVSEDVQDYPRPPLCEPVSYTIESWFAGTCVARSSRAWRVCETHHAPTYYIPSDDVTGLVPVGGASFCEWKGRARYFDLVVGAERASRAAWSYPEPTPGFAAIRDFIAIYPEALERALVAGIVATPQPGSFYGGWVTPNLAGIVKGGPGTEGW